jgi:hypothetical protein
MKSVRAIFSSSETDFDELGALVATVDQLMRVDLRQRHAQVKSSIMTSFKPKLKA